MFVVGRRRSFAAAAPLTRDAERRGVAGRRRRFVVVVIVGVVVGVVVNIGATKSVETRGEKKRVSSERPKHGKQW